MDDTKTPPARHKVSLDLMKGFESTQRMAGSRDGRTGKEIAVTITIDGSGYPVVTFQVETWESGNREIVQHINTRLLEEAIKKYNEL
jgi:hypothetical protein